MPDKPSDPNGGEFSVRLSWPKPGETPPPVAPVHARPGPTRTVRTVEPKPFPPVPDPAAAGAPEGEASPATLPRAARSPELPPLPGGADGVPAGRAFVDAFDRLADRLLDRLRTLRQDVDADLTGVRSELASLRQVIDELGDRSQLREVLGSVEELRTELAALRRAVLEWPELEQVSNDIAAVRGDIAFLFEADEGTSVAPPSELLRDLRSTIDLLSATVGTFSDEISRMGQEMPQVDALKAVLEEVASVRSELTEVRRRMRSGPLDAEQLDQIAAAVAERVLEDLQQADGRRRRR